MYLEEKTRPSQHLSTSSDVAVKVEVKDCPNDDNDLKGSSFPLLLPSAMHLFSKAVAEQRGSHPSQASPLSTAKMPGKLESSFNRSRRTSTASEEYIDEPGLSGDNSVGHWPVKLSSWSREEDRRGQEEETLSRRVTARQRSLDEREKRMHLEKEEKFRMDAEGDDYGTDETEEEVEERKKQEEEETGKWEDDGSKRKQGEDARQGFQDWDPSGSYSQQINSFLSPSCLTFIFADCFGLIYCDGLSTTQPVSAALQQEARLPEGSVPHSESIQERLCRLDEMNLSESRILLLEKIHQEMWADLPTIGFIKWDDLPWPVFVRTTCPEDLMLHRIVLYLLQVSSRMDIKEALMDSSRLQWAQQRLRIVLGRWGQPGLQKTVENSADKTMIQGLNVVTDHLKSILDFVNTDEIDEKHRTDLTAIVSQSFLKHVGQSLARILTDTSDNSGYKSLLRLEGDSAQKMLNFLQMVCHVTCLRLVSIFTNLITPSCLIIRA